MTTVVGRPRINKLLIVLIQASAGAVAFVLWAIQSRVSSAEVVFLTASAFSVAMVLFLPLTLGLPYLMANFFRDDADADGSNVSNRRFSVYAVACTSSSFGVVGGGITVAASSSSTWLRIGLALCLAGTLCVGVMLQQLARIRVSPVMTFIGSTSAVAFPVVYVVVSRLDLSTYTSGLCASTVMLVLTLIQAGLSVRLIDSGGRIDWRQSVRRLLPRSLPLIPHLLAMGALLQGVRLSASLYGSAELIIAAHYVTLFLSIAVGGIQGIHGLLTVGVQMHSEVGIHSKVRRSALLYGLLGLVSSLGVAVLYLSPLRSVFVGSQPLSSAGSVALAVLPASVCLYYFLSALCVREGLTSTLAIFTCSAAATMLAISPLVADYGLSSLLILYAIVMTLLPCCLLARLSQRPQFDGWRLVSRCVPLAAVGYAGALLVLITVSAADVG